MNIKQTINKLQKALIQRGKDGRMEELKACPFCGGTPNVCSNIEENGYIIDEKTRYAVRCSVGCFAMTNKYKTEKEAIEAWNNRV